MGWVGEVDQEGQSIPDAIFTLPTANRAKSVSAIDRDRTESSAVGAKQGDVSVLVPEILFPICEVGFV